MVIWEHVRLMQRPGASNKFFGEDSPSFYSQTAVNLLAVVSQMKEEQNGNM